MRASSLGEFGLIEKIRRSSRSGRSARAKKGRGVIVGIGDDAAVFRPSPGSDLLLTTDLLLEGVHFKRETARPADVGYKAVAVNLSDIAAMGGIPRCYLVSLLLPPAFTVEGVGEIYRGMQEAASESDLVLAGGNISASERLGIDITLVGEVARGAAVTRSGSRPGDLLFVTGTLGDAAAGLALLSRGKRKSPGGFPFLVRRHRRPTARWREGRLLAGVASAMIDLSDGLSSDLSHLCKESGVGAVVGASLLPLSGSLRAFCRRTGEDPLEYALHGGEDYELLFSVPRRKMEPLFKLAGETGVKLTPIGKVISRRGCWVSGTERVVPLHPKGYDHFRSRRAQGA
jgi:thiamine-monophosphate kinase